MTIKLYNKLKETGIFDPNKMDIYNLYRFVRVFIEVLEQQKVDL